MHHIPSTNKVVVYETSFFSLASSSQLVKLNAYGQVEWAQVLENDSVDDFWVQFDRVFVLSKQGELRCYDARLGYLLWAQDQLNISRLTFGYPFIFYVTSKAQLGAMDFMTGQRQWVAKGSFRRVVSVDYGASIVAELRAKGRPWVAVSSATGKRLSKVKKWRADKRVVASIQGNRQILKDGDQWQLIDPISQTAIWASTFVESDHFFVQGTTLVLLKEGQGWMKQLVTGESLGVTINISEKENFHPRAFVYRPDGLFFMGDSEIVKVDL